MIERAYMTAERLGLQLWCEDEGGPYQSIPHPGSSWQPEGQPARRPHEYVRGETAKLLTLFRPATGEVRAEAVEHSTNAVLHPWLKGELEAILKQCPAAPEVVPQGRRWQDWDIYPAAEQLDRFFPPVRVLLILDNLAGHKSYPLVQWCAEHGILLLWTPTAGRLSQHGRVAATHHPEACAFRSAPSFRPDAQEVAHRRSRGLESASDSVHLGRQTPCPSRPGLRTAAPPGRIRGDDNLHRSSPYPFGSLLQESGLMPLDLTTDPLVGNAI